MMPWLYHATMSTFPWTCPYCNRNATITGSNYASNKWVFDEGNKDGSVVFQCGVIVCPNSSCGEYVITASTVKGRYVGGGVRTEGQKLAEWRLKPLSSAKPIPDYVPEPIRNDYEEACLIATLSPKASATLSRRCLQGMIRDFHGISEKTLWFEIQNLKGKVDDTTWGAIDAVRSIGNIGAHMETDISVIVDVDPGEAQLLIELIETLIDEWYVHRHERQQRMAAIVAVASAKKELKDQAPNAALPSPQPATKLKE